MSACCEIGMELLNLGQDFVYENLVQIISSEWPANKKTFPWLISPFYAEDQAINSGLFWTSGSDQGSEGNFAFINSMEFLPRTAKCWQLLGLGFL